MSEIVRVEGLSISYDGKDVLDGVGFALKDGEVLAVIGPNGSGKTTLLKAMLGLLRPKAGEVRLFGGEGRRSEKLISYIPQRMEVDRTFPITLREMLGLRGRDASAIEKYLDVLDLRGILSKRVGDLSGGQMQRALLAYAILREPKLLVMDEPTSWVDAKGADCVLCIMEEFKKKGIAMIVVSHDFSVVSAIATSVLGIGHEGHFFLQAGSPNLAEKIEALFGTTHHGTGLCRIY